MNTVSDIFSELDRARVEWAVIRNYENLPDLSVAETKNTDLDLVVRRADVPRVREALLEVARRQSWDALTECDHYVQSRVEHHRIEVFRFYRLEPFEFLQVDVFHAYLLWGLPVLKEAEMLEGRQRIPERRLAHIAPAKENMYRLLQVEALFRSKRNGAKRERYRRRLLEYATAHGPELRASVAACLSPLALRALEALRNGDGVPFRRWMALARVHFLLGAIVRRPAETVRYILARRRDERMRFETRPCGAVLRVRASGTRAGVLLRAALSELVCVNAIDEWRERSAGGGFSRRERDVLEQGGLLIEFSTAGEYDVAIDENADAATVITALQSFLIRRHRILHGSAEFSPLAQQPVLA
ncbi:MAG: hypothetical protein ABSF98_17035 [Bryobacteraceae bacterium]|jgi:hypothetical protein